LPASAQVAPLLAADPTILAKDAIDETGVFNVILGSLFPETQTATGP
jgi:hypothetical protein